MCACLFKRKCVKIMNGNNIVLWQMQGDVVKKRERERKRKRG